MHSAALFLGGDVIYQALYRKYRPRTFDDVAGQEHITGVLKKQVETGKLSHAYLFIGTRGTGKTTCAKILAKAVNCQNPRDGNPCNVCDACRGIDDGSVLDVVEIDAASNNGVDNVRALREEAVFSPANVSKRVYIIDEVHMLSTSAFNALLKILEEPPSHLMFILATTELRKVPATILSRCQRYGFRRLDAPVIAGRLRYVAEQEHLALDSDACDLIARLAEGSMRDGLSLLDQCSASDPIDEDAVLDCLGLAGNRRMTDLLDTIANGDATAALELFASLWRDGKDPSALLGDLCSLMRDILLLSLAPKNGERLLSSGCDAAALRRFSSRFTNAELLRAMERLSETAVSLKDSPSPKTAVELCLVALCDSRLCDGLPELRARISRLEERGVPAAVPEAEPKPKARAALCKPAPEPVIKPEPEPEPVPTPEPEPEPEPVHEAVPEPPAKTEQGDTRWSRFAEFAAGRFRGGDAAYFKDPLHCSGVFTPGRLTLKLSAGFIYNRMSRPETVELIRQAAREFTGGDVAVTAEPMDGTEAVAQRSIDELAKFPQTKII